MGYDMYWKHEPAEVQEAYAAVSANRGSYDADVYQRWNDAQDKHGSYFRLNIFGMGAYRKHMAERGMLANIDNPKPWPEQKDFGVSDADWDNYDSDDKSTWTPALAAYKAATDAVVEFETGGLMPAYKFGSNDSWLVTPDEITKSLEALHRWEDKQRDLHGQSWVDPLSAQEEGYWNKWLRFLYCARGYGGVIVR